MSEILTISEMTLITGDGAGLARNPAAVYLAGLGSETSRRTMLAALSRIADVIYPDRWTRPEKPTAPARVGRKASPAERSTYNLAVEQHKTAYAAYRAAMEQWSQRALDVSWAELRYQHATAIRTALSQELSYQGVNKHLAALRRVMKEAYKLDLIDADTYGKIALVENVKGKTLPAGRSITSGELHALMDDCMSDQTPAGVRDAAIIGLLYSCGLRRAELVKLDLGDYVQDTGELRILGKRNKERKVYAVNGTIDALADWLDLRGDDDGALFWSIRKGGHIERGQRLTTQAVYHILTKRAEQAEVKELSPHDFRRTFVGDLLDAGADIATVQKMAGHANVQTTARYDRRPEEAKRKAASLLHVPYRRRTLVEAEGDGGQ
jgi:site-specific recombinase XerD